MVKLRNATARELLNSIIHYHFGQTLNGVSLKEIGRPPSFTSAWFSQTMTLKFSRVIITSLYLGISKEANSSFPVYLVNLRLENIETTKFARPLSNAFWLTTSEHLPGNFHSCYKSTLLTTCKLLETEPISTDR